MEPLVSVIMPVCNAEKYLALALQSVLKQTLSDFECIAINDGSTDGSAAILERYAKRDRRLRVISRPNTGIVGALNEGIAAARGSLLARMDGDDICAADRFERQVQYLREHPEVVLVGSNVLMIDADGSPISPMRDVAFGQDVIDHALLTRGWPIVHPAVLMRTAAVRQIGGYRDLCPHEDHDLFLRLAETGGKLENLPEVLLQYRKHDGSISASQSDLNIEHLTQVIADACRRRGIPVPAEITGPIVREHLTKARVHRDWAWQSIQAHNLATARKYAFSALRRAPLCIENWRVTYCAVRGR